MIATITPTCIPAKHAKVAYIAAAVADGFEVFEGPWGNNLNDWTVDILKEDSALDGKFLIRLVERYLVFPWREEKNYDSSVSAWFIANSHEKGTAARQQAIKISTDSYNYAELVMLANSCTECHSNVGIEKLTRIAFANAACPDCCEPASQKLEFAGWAD